MRPAPTGSAGRRTPTCSSSSPGRAARSARSTRCSLAAPRPVPCCPAATTSTTTRASVGPAPTATTSRCTATTSGSSSSVAGLADRCELAVELLDPGAAGRAGHGRRLIRAGLATLAPGTVCWAQVSPGNAASLRAFLACGFVPIGSEILIRRGSRLSTVDPCT